MPTPSGTYNHNLHHKMPDVLTALQIAKALAHDVGTDDDIARIEYAIRQIKACEIMYSDECVAAMNEMAEQCATYGAD